MIGLFLGKVCFQVTIFYIVMPAAFALDLILEPIQKSFDFGLFLLWSYALRRSIKQY
jgi:hypothetical protein